MEGSALRGLIRRKCAVSEVGACIRAMRHSVEGCSGWFLGSAIFFTLLSAQCQLREDFLFFSEFSACPSAADCWVRLRFGCVWLYVVGSLVVWCVRFSRGILDHSCLRVAFRCLYDLNPTPAGHVTTPIDHNLLSELRGPAAKSLDAGSRTGLDSTRDIEVGKVAKPFCPDPRERVQRAAALLCSRSEPETSIEWPQISTGSRAVPPWH